MKKAAHVPMWAPFFLSQVLAMWSLQWLCEDYLSLILPDPHRRCRSKGKNKHLVEHEYLILNAFINPVEAQWCGGAGWNKRLQCCRYNHAQGQVLCIPFWTSLSGVAQEPPVYFAWGEYVRGKQGQWEEAWKVTVWNQQSEPDFTLTGKTVVFH